MFLMLCLIAAILTQWVRHDAFVAWSIAQL